MKSFFKEECIILDQRPKDQRPEYDDDQTKCINYTTFYMFFLHVFNQIEHLA